MTSTEDVVQYQPIYICEWAYIAGEDVMLQGEHKSLFLVVSVIIQVSFSIRWPFVFFLFFFYSL